MPGFVYAITIVEFVLFFSFAVNMVLRYARIGRWGDYIHGEVVYIVLSFTAKSWWHGSSAPMSCAPRARRCQLAQGTEPSGGGRDLEVGHGG
jgi:hypothetical protein